MLRDPTMLADVSELVRDNDAILADYINQMKYGKSAKEVAYQMKIKHIIETSRKKPD